MKSDGQLKRWHAKYNRLYFQGKLPDAIVYWETIASGYADFDVNADGQHVIRVNPGFAGWQSVAKFALLHEMAHQSLHPYSKHGRKFHAVMLRLASEGAFNDLW